MRSALIILLIVFSLGFSIEEIATPFYLDYESYVSKMNPNEFVAKKEVYSIEGYNKLNSEEKENLYFQTYFVTTTGSSGNNGLSEGAAWSFSHADNTAQAGDLIWVKSGNYGNQNLSFTVSGNLSNRIRFVGYKNTTGDIVTTNAPSRLHTDAVSATEMPLLTGTSRSSGIAVSVTGDYVTLENIQITNYVGGVYGSGDNVTLRNMFVVELGDLGNNTPSNISDDPYSGVAFSLSGESVLVENTIGRNAGAEIMVTKGGSNGRVLNSYFYADEAQNPTDYFVSISNGGTGWLVEGITVHRTQGLVHGGHGLMVKSDGQNNTFRNCIAIGTQCEVNFAGANNNLFDEITMIGYGTDTGNWHTRIFVANGAHHNTFRNYNWYNINNAVIFGDYDDAFTPSPDTDELAGGFDNTFENHTGHLIDQFISGTYAVAVTGSDSHESARNHFENISLGEVRIFCTTITDWSDFTFENVGIHNLTSNLLFNIGPNGTSTNFVSTNSKYYQRAGAGTNTGWSQTGDPLYLNSALTETSHYQLQVGSPWIGLGSNGIDIGYQFSEIQEIDSFFDFIIIN